MALTIINLLKQVPLPAEMRMNEEGLMDRVKAKSIINIECTYALEAGLELKQQYNGDTRLIVCSMGPSSFIKSLKDALALGYDEAYLLSDRKLGGSDTYSTGLALSTLIKHLGFYKNSKDPFIIITGRQTSDGDTAHIPSQVAANLDIPQATFAEEINLDENYIIAKRIIEGGHQIIKIPFPCVVSITPTGTPIRKPTLSGVIKSRNTDVNILNLEDINLSPTNVGIKGSPTIVSGIKDIVNERPPIILANGNSDSEKVQNLIKNLQSKSTQILQKAEVKDKINKEIPSDFAITDIRKNSKGILTWAEVTDDKIADSSIEILTPAKELACNLGENTKITTLLIGDNVSDKANELIEYGADKVIVVNDKRLKEYQILPFTSIFEQVINDIKPEIALFAATTAGRELAPRVAVKTNSGVTADCTKLEIGEYVNNKEKTVIRPILLSHRPTYGESKLATIISFKFPQISTIRPGTFISPEKQTNREGKITSFTPTLSDDVFKSKILTTVRESGNLQNLFTADIIISGGRGTVCDDLRLVKDLCNAFKDKGYNAEWATSRTVVDQGYAEYSRQIGQTGKTVRPKYYFAIGISGAIQHLAGIKDAGKIIAINNNPNAAIFNHADFGIVGEYEYILPELIENVKNGNFDKIFQITNKKDE
jgi:electron transfer flavoprotein alpha subunit